MSYIQTDMTQREVELNTLVTRYRAALESIAINTCCEQCQEAARVAQDVLYFNQH